MKAELVPENGDPPIPILKDLTVIGRKSYCDVVVDHHSLSKRHAIVVKTDGLLVIRDLATTNGTKVKGQRIRWAALLPDDRISLGACKFRVYLGSDEVPSPSELPFQPQAGKKVSTSKLGPKSDAGFPSPSPLEVVIPDGLEIIEDDLELIEDDDENDQDSNDDSGWRKLIGNKAKRSDDDMVIELD